MDMPMTAIVFMTLVLKPLIILLLLLVITLLLRKQSASLQHFVLALGLIGVLVLPLVGWVTPHISWYILPVTADINNQLSLWLSQLYSLLSWKLGKHELMIVAGCYVFIASWFIFYFLLGVFGLYQQTQTSQQMSDQEFKQLVHDLCDILDIKRPVILVTSREVSSPQMWGFIRPTIMLPKEAVLWDYDKKLAVVMHELGHIRRYDWLVTAIVKITCAIFWFLPPVWWLAHKLYQQAEIASDDFIFRLRDKHILYAESLLAFAGGDHGDKAESSLRMLGHSALYERINAILDKNRSHQPVPIEAAQYWVLLGAFFFALMASVELLPIKKLLLNSVSENRIVHIRHSSPAVDTDASDVLIKSFDWAKLKNLQQQSHSRPSEPTYIETVSIRAPRERKVEFSDELMVSEPRIIQKPEIQVQGYLPLNVVMPEYPVAALSKGVEGWVQVGFSIGVNGEVLDPYVIDQYPSKVFSKAALKAIAQSRYRPQFFDGQPVIMQGVVEKFVFTLQASPSSDRRR